MTDVRIENVGGSRPSAGVASEATLQELVRVLNKSGQSNTASQLNQRYQRDYVREISNTTKAKGTLRQAATDLTREFVTGGDRLSDFSEHILKTNGILQRLIRFSDGLVDQFRAFSSVGASFNNNIFDMRTSALQAAMNLESFQDLVLNNSDTLRLFGSSVTDGTKQFTQLSRQFRTLNPQFFDMGFTIEDINEGLLNYTELLARTGRTEQINSKNMVENSAAYLQQLDLLAKATGQSREALARQSEDINNDARMRAFLARANSDNADAMSMNAALVMSFAPGLRDSLLNLGTFGVASDDISQLLEITGGEAEELANLFRRMRDMDPDDFMDEFIRLGPAAMDRVNELVDPAVLASHDGLRQLNDAVVDLGRLRNVEGASLRREQAQRNTVTSTLANFSQTIQELRAFIVEQIINSPAFSALGTLGEDLLKLVTPSEEGSLPNFQGTLTRAINALVGEDGIITKAITWVNDLIKSDDFSEKLTGFVNTLTRMTGRIVDFFLGAEQDLPSGETQRQGGLFSNMYTMFEDLFSEEREGNFGSRVMSIIVDGFKGIFNTLGTTIVEQFELGQVEGESPWTAIYNAILDRLGLDQAEGEEKSLLERISDKFSTAFENFWQGETGQRLINTVTGFFEELLDNLLIALSDIIPGFKAQGARERQIERSVSSGRELTDEQEDLRRQLLRQAERDAAAAQREIDDIDLSTMDQHDPYSSSAYSAAQQDLREQEQKLQSALDILNRFNPQTNVVPTTPETRRIGTLQATGMRAEPKDTVAQIHQGERVLNPQETEEYNNRTGSNNQSNVVEKLDQLNNTMLMVASLMNQEIAIQTRTMNNISGLGPDLMKGMPG